MNARRPGTAALAIVAAAVLSIMSTGSVTAADGDPYIVKDIRAGDASSDPGDLAAIGALVYFNADDGSHGRELWRSNGSAAGTWMVCDIAPGAADSTPREMTSLGKKFVFSALDPTAGRELWISNGTRDGTKRLLDIRPGTKGSKPADLTVLGALVFFTADDGVHGRELWRTDGTVAGTRMVNDLTPGPNRNGPLELTALGTRLFFVARTGLWKTDDNAAGMRRVLDRNGHAIQRPRSLVASGPYLYFAARNSFGDLSLWRTAGLNSTTRPLLDHVVPQNLTGAAGRLFFSLPGAPGEMSQLWKSDGTRAGTVLVRDVWTVTEMTAVGTYLYFVSTNPDGWEALFVSNGTADGTSSWSSRKDSGTTELTAVDGVLFYTLWGYLWYDSCPTGDCSEYSWAHSVVPYDDGASTSWNAHGLTGVGGTLFYSGWDDHAPDDHGQELWAYVP